ncbi:MAG TPA: DMT family protein [Polyangiaceae bacterium]|nr:DMT family protein [Polyangiaceae bacterium]
MNVVPLSLALLVLANVFMTFAWYGHLSFLHDRPLWLAIMVSWGIAFFEYCLQVPANRLGFGALSLAQLKISQEVITMVVFMAFSRLYMKRPLSMDQLYATGCLVLAAYFMFRGGAGEATT